MVDETQKAPGDATPKGQDSQAAAGSNSQAPKTFSEADHKKGIEDAVAQYGDRIKREKLDPISKELEKLRQDLADAQKRRDEEEEAKLKDNPEELDLLTRRKKIRETELAHKQRQTDLDAREEALKGREAKVAESEWAGLVFEVASGVKGDAVKLRERANALGITDADKLKDLAILMWPQELPAADSGEHEGGGTDWSKKTPEERIAEQRRRDRVGK